MRKLMVVLMRKENRPKVPTKLFKRKGRRGGVTSRPTRNKNLKRLPYRRKVPYSIMKN